MNFVESFIYKKPRLAGLLIFLLGIGYTGHLIWAYREHNSFFSKDLSYAPATLLIGLCMLAEPRILLVWRSEGNNPPPAGYKVMSIAVIVIAVGIGLYLRYVVFKNWQPTRFSLSS